jgi:cytochrome d ubiquinol oxidase subunit II
MITFWYAAVSVMLAVYVVLDGFDLGAGAVHFLVARSERERRAVFAAIGPVWDGNEVWLLAGGGALFAAFPTAYAVGFSGFYLPLMLVLWLLFLRGLSIELRSHVEDRLWADFWDAVFAFASAALAVVLGAALGNVVRGVPLDGSGNFIAPLFTNFLLGERPGVLDVYTCTIGLFALAALSLHGAGWLILRVDGPVADRARALARRLFPLVAALGLAAVAFTAHVHLRVYQHLAARPWTLLLVAAAALGLVAQAQGLYRDHSGRARFLPFAGSSLFLLSTLAATAAGMFPLLLRSSISPAYDLDAAQAASSGAGLRTALAWWCVGMPLALGYTLHMYRSLRTRIAS